MIKYMQGRRRSVGIIYKAYCPECKYETKIYLGGGLFSINLKKSAVVLPEKEQEQVFNLLEKGKVKDFIVEKRITECKSCQIIESHTIIDITEKNGSSYRFGDICNRCKNKMIIYNEGADGKYLCPDCHKGILMFLEEGLWD